MTNEELKKQVIEGLQETRNVNYIQEVEAIAPELSSNARKLAKGLRLAAKVAETVANIYENKTTMMAAGTFFQKAHNAFIDFTETVIDEHFDDVKDIEEEANKL